MSPDVPFPPQEALQSIATDPGLYQMLPRFSTFISEGVSVPRCPHRVPKCPPSVPKSPQSVPMCPLSVPSVPKSPQCVPMCPQIPPK